MQNPFTAGAESAAVSKAKMGAEIITQTLDNLNSPTYASGKKKSKSCQQSAMSQTYDLSKSVLSAVYEGKGIGIDNKG